MHSFIGLDVSQRTMAICVIDESGKKPCEGKTLTLRSDIHSWITAEGIAVANVEGVCLEAGAMSSYLYKGLSERG